MRRGARGGLTLGRGQVRGQAQVPSPPFNEEGWITGVRAAGAKLVDRER